MGERIEVKVGQTWADNDKRYRSRLVPNRYVYVTEIVDGKAVCEAWHDAPASLSRTVRIRLDRFRPNSTGYRLVIEAGA